MEPLHTENRDVRVKRLSVGSVIMVRGDVTLVL